MDRNGDGMILGVASHLLDLLSQFDECFVLYPRATRARNNIQVAGIDRYHTSQASGIDVVDDFSAGDDFLVFLRIGNRQWKREPYRRYPGR